MLMEKALVYAKRCYIALLFQAKFCAWPPNKLDMHNTHWYLSMQDEHVLDNRKDKRVTSGACKDKSSGFMSIWSTEHGAQQR